MAEEQLQELRQTRIKETRIHGSALVGRTIQRTGDIEFVFTIEKPDRSRITIPQQFTIPPDLFAPPGRATVEAQPVATEELIPELEHIDSFIKSIRLPVKKRILGSIKPDVGTYLYYLVSTTELEKYLVAANQLEKIGQTITDSPSLQTQIGDLYAEFMTLLKTIEETRTKLRGLEAKRAVRSRLLQIIDAFIPRFTEELRTEFKKQFNVDGRALRATVFVNNSEYLTWLMANASRIDTILGVSTSEFNLSSLYKFIDSLTQPTIDMYYQIEAIRNTAKKIRRKLAKSQ